MNGFDSYRLRERADIARLVLIAAFVVLCSAFFRTQVIQHDKFQLKAETNRLRPIPLTPPRGSILDRHGRVIAENVPGYSVKLLASSTDSLLAVLNRLRRFVPVDSARVVDILERFRQARYQPALIFGKAGLERQYDDTLRGTEGVRYIEVNARGRLVREGAASASLPPTPGNPITTTIDLDLQRFIDSIWPAGVRGAMVALTPQGEVRALYSAPTFDPNKFVGGISSADWRRVNTDPARPLLNRVIQARYPPASPFKLAISAMALKRGLIRLSTRMPEPCRGGLRLGNRVFRCWKKDGHGMLDLIGAVAASCDVYFYQLGLQLGLDAIIQDGVFMGFRDKSGIDLENELSPIWPSSTAYFDRLYRSEEHTSE